MSVRVRVFTGAVKGTNPRCFWRQTNDDRSLVNACEVYRVSAEDINYGRAGVGDTQIDRGMVRHVQRYVRRLYT